LERHSGPPIEKGGKKKGGNGKVEKKEEGRRKG
jgi:hypothetical protein